MLEPVLLRVTNALRLPVSRLLGAGVLLMILLSRHATAEGGLVDVLDETLGLVLIGVCAFGRLWTLMYISGFKNRRVLTVGPYSIVRHPLYVFSLVGAIGIGLATERASVLALLLGVYAVIYPLVILAEERKLLARHGEAYRAYMARTPRFIPNLALLEEPAEYAVNAQRFRRAFADAMWFVWLYALLELVESLHEAGLLPALAALP